MTERARIKTMLPPDVKFSLRRVDFTDLARESAYELKIKRGDEELPGIFLSQEHRDAWLDVIEAREKIKKTCTYKGCRII